MYDYFMESNSDFNINNTDDYVFCQGCGAMNVKDQRAYSDDPRKYHVACYHFGGGLSKYNWVVFCSYQCWVGSNIFASKFVSPHKNDVFFLYSRDLKVCCNYHRESRYHNRRRLRFRKF